VPPLNLMVQPLDWAGAALEKRFQRSKLRPPDWLTRSSARQTNFGHMAVWISLFAFMFGTGFVEGRHPGSNPDFWRRACEEGRRNACETWTRTLKVSCQHGSGGACATLGSLWKDGRVVAQDSSEAGRDFARACDLGAPNACSSLVALVQSEGQDVFRPGCERGDGESCFILASLHYAGRGVSKDYGRAVSLFRQSCESGWWRGCGGLAECYRAGQGVAADPTRAIEYFERGCRGGIAASCFSVATMYRGMSDEVLARQRLQEGCDFSIRNATANAAYFKPGVSLQSAAAPAFCAQPNP
jgi:TPR repeat protein